MKPPKKENIEFEKVAIGEFIHGTIEKVQYDMNHKFRGFQGAEDTVQPAIRFRFKLDRYIHHHYSRWMKFTLGQKSNLYQKYAAKLITNLEPDMEIDLDILNGMRVKTLWSENNGYQNIENIFPEKNKLPLDSKVSESEPEEIADEEDMPEELR